MQGLIIDTWSTSYILGPTYQVLPVSTDNV